MDSRQLQHSFVNSFGIACFFSCFVILLFRHTDAIFSSHMMLLVLFALFVGILYIAAAYLTDLLTAIGPIPLTVTAVVLGIVGILMLELSYELMLNLIGGCLATVSFVLLSMVWGKNLSHYNKDERMSVLCSSFILVAIFTALSFCLVNGALLVIEICLPVVSLLHLMTFQPTKGSFVFANYRDTRKSFHFNFRPLLITGLTGYIWGIAFFLVLKPDTFNEIPVAPIFVSLPLAIGALIGLVDSFTSRRVNEEFLLRFFAFASIIAILPLPFVPEWVRLLCGAYLFLLFSLDTIMCFSAIAETARFNQLSPYWAFGISLSYYAVGAIIAYTLFGWVFTLGIYVAEIVVCLGSVVLIVGLSDFIFRNSYYPGYGFCSDIAAANESLAAGAKKPAVWQMKINYVMDKYELTTRQREVFKMLARGRNAQFVAKEFYISFSTAKAHIHNIYMKLDIHSQQELIDLVESAPIKSE